MDPMDPVERLGAWLAVAGEPAAVWDGAVEDGGESARETRVSEVALAAASCRVGEVLAWDLLGVEWAALSPQTRVALGCRARRLVDAAFNVDDRGVVSRDTVDG